MQGVVRGGFVLAMGGQTNSSQPGTQSENYSQMILYSLEYLPGIL